MPQFTDATGGVGGTALDAAHLNALAVAVGFLLSGGVPTANGTLTVTQPATVAVIPQAGQQAVAVTKTSQSLTWITNQTVYLDLDTSGTYHQVYTNPGDPEPAVTANSVRLWKGSSAGGAVSNIAQVLRGSPFPGIVTTDHQNLGSDVTLTADGAWHNLGIAAAIASAVGGTKLRARLSGFVRNQSTSYWAYVVFRLSLTTPGGTTTINLSAATSIAPCLNVGASPSGASVAGEIIAASNLIAGGAYSADLQYQCGQMDATHYGTPAILAQTANPPDGMHFVLEEL